MISSSEILRYHPMALKEGGIDVAIGGITIAEEREPVFDFTYPVYHTGLDLLIPETGKGTLLGLITALFD